ncbi:hypothetical protein Bca101_053389 [Brassica carinata]
MLENLFPPYGKRWKGSGEKGAVLNFVTHDDERMLFDIQKFHNVVVEELPASVANLLCEGEVRHDSMEKKGFHVTTLCIS